MLTDAFVPLISYPDVTPTSAFAELALLLHAFAKTVTVCAFEMDIPDLSNRLSSKSLDTAGAAAAAEARSRATAKALVEAATSSSLTVTPKTVRVTQQQLGTLAETMARSHDVSLVEVDPASAEKTALAQSLIFGSGRPVLVVPEGLKGNWDLGKIAIAWDGGRAASRAVHDAMPLLAKAGHASLVSAFDDKDIGEHAALDLAEYLERHEISSSHLDVSVAGRTVGAALQHAALSQGAGLLVMGAFGHSRLRDFVLGGATQSTLRALKLPVLFSH